MSAISGTRTLAGEPSAIADAVDGEESLLTLHSQAGATLIATTILASASASWTRTW
jgi:hypothetical protein